MVVGDERFSDGKSILFNEANNRRDIPSCIHHQRFPADGVADQIGEVLHGTNFDLLEIE